jgi:hypothetical protein
VTSKTITRHFVLSGKNQSDVIRTSTAAIKVQKSSFRLTSAIFAKTTHLNGDCLANSTSTVIPPHDFRENINETWARNDAVVQAHRTEMHHTLGDIRQSMYGLSQYLARFYQYFTSVENEHKRENENMIRNMSSISNTMKSPLELLHTQQTTTSAISNQAVPDPFALTIGPTKSSNNDGHHGAQQ